LKSPHYRPPTRVAVASLLTGALVWGLIWYPYRVLETAGLPGVRASVLTYLVALVLGLFIILPRLRGERPSWWLLAVGLAAAGGNIGYVLGMLHGEVMRVLLLFYLAPLWTVVLARLLLGERPGRLGLVVIATSLAGAVTMLWQPQLGLPLPNQTGEWLGLGAGFLFALTNVLIRRTPQHGIELKVMVIFFSTVVLGLAALPFEAAGWGGGALWPALAVPPDTDAGQGQFLMLVAMVVMVAIIGLVLLAVNLVAQFGLTHVPANRAIVIFMAELAVAAVSSWLLAGEVMGPNEWLGGTLIVVASLASARLAVAGETG